MTITSTFILTLLRDGLVTLLACAVLAGTALSLYLLLLAVAGLRRPQEAKANRGREFESSPELPTTKFAIIIPAHEEELVIGRLLESVNDLDYPPELFEVHVIADHCTDQTVDAALNHGAIVHERIGANPRGKSRSLQWLVQRLLARKSGDSIEAFVFFDADSIVSRNFLRTMDSSLRAGNPITQGLILVDDPGTDAIGLLRALAYEFISHVRPLGRSALGLSAGLRGNGMCMSRDCAARFAWDSDSLTEDYELHGRLLAAGLRVAFAPDAVVRTELPQSLDVARSQSERWERGRLDAMRRHVPRLLADGLRRRSWSSIDGAIELLTPPFSILIALMLALVGLSILTGTIPLIATAITGFVALCLYTLRGLALASSRYPHIYRSFLFVPGFIIWRLWLYVGVLARRGPVQWTRTVRTPVASDPASRICIVRHYYYPEDPRSRREAEALAAAGHRVDIITLRHPGEPAREVINGVNVLRLPVQHYRRSYLHYAYEYCSFFALTFLVLAARLVRRRYDVVQVNSLPDFLVLAAAPAKVFGARIVLDMHECTPELFCTKYRVPLSHPAVRLLAWVEQRSLGFADQVITCTPQQRDIFASRGTSPEKITVVLNAANSAIFRPRTKEPVLWQPGERFDLVAHGLVAERYGLDTMVRAVALLACDIPGIKLHIYGKGDYLSEVVALAGRLGVGERVIAHGFVPQEELLEGIGTAHVGVIAAKRDKFRDLTHTQKMYEYVAMRKPVVIAETSAVRTHFDDSCFQFFTSDDPVDLARALRELYHDPDRAVAMVRSAGRRYRTYDWDAQRHVYCGAVLGSVPRHLEPAGAPRVRTVPPERMAEVVPAELRPVPVEAILAPADLRSMTLDATMALSPMDLSEIVTPVDGDLASG